MSVFFENESGQTIPDKYEFIVSDIIGASIDYMNCPYPCEVNVIFTDNEGIKEINREYRQIDSPTDVLSFPLVDYEQAGTFEHLKDCPVDYFNQDSGELMLGDIILNINKISEQADLYGHTKRRELAFLTAHSMLHLFGFDHIDDIERQNMEILQEEILTTKGYTRENEEE